jgi:transcription antitermination factor NusG
MSAGDEIRRARNRLASATLQIGQQVRIIKGAFAGLTASIHKNDIGGRWVLTLDGLGDKLYVILTEDAFETGPADH